jgi:hypothetical protein
MTDLGRRVFERLLGFLLLLRRCSRAAYRYAVEVMGARPRGSTPGETVKTRTNLTGPL